MAKQRSSDGPTLIFTVQEPLFLPQVAKALALAMSSVSPVLTERPPSLLVATTMARRVEGRAGARALVGESHTCWFKASSTKVPHQST